MVHSLYFVSDHGCWNLRGAGTPALGVRCLLTLTPNFQIWPPVKCCLGQHDPLWPISRLNTELIKLWYSVLITYVSTETITFIFRLSCYWSCIYLICIVNKIFFNLVLWPTDNFDLKNVILLNSNSNSFIDTNSSTRYGYSPITQDVLTSLGVRCLLTLTPNFQIWSPVKCCLGQHDPLWRDFAHFSVIKIIINSLFSVQSRNWSQGVMLAQATFDRGPNLKLIIKFVHTTIDSWNIC
jgi:hypothetical protein